MARLPDPLCAFALAAYLSLFAIFAQSLRLVAALLVLSLLSVSLMGVSLSRVMRQLRRLWQVILTIAILQSCFSASGVIWIRVGSVTLLTSGGVEKGLLVFCRLSILVLSGALFTLYRPGELIRTLIRLKLPYEIAYMVSAGLRFVPMMGEELRDSLTALALRGVSVEEMKLRRRIKVYLYLLLPMIAGCLHKAGRLAMAMEMRGFGAYPRRTSYVTYTMRRSDYGIVCAAALLALLTGAAILSGFIR